MTAIGEIVAVIVAVIVALAFFRFADDVTDKDHEEDDETGKN